MYLLPRKFRKMITDIHCTILTKKFSLILFGFIPVIVCGFGSTLKTFSTAEIFFMSDTLVIGVADNLQVLNSVISGYFIAVMDVFFLFQSSFNMLFHYPTVFINISQFICIRMFPHLDHHIPMRHSVSTFPVPRFITLLKWHLQTTAMRNYLIVSEEI